MLSAEIQRVLLLIGLGVTGYLMILAWNRDYVQVDEPLEYSAAPEFEGETSSDLPVPAAGKDNAPPVSDILTRRWSRLAPTRPFPRSAPGAADTEQRSSG
jgi:hypothetical protein